MDDLIYRLALITQTARIVNFNYIFKTTGYRKLIEDKRSKRKVHNQSILSISRRIMFLHTLFVNVFFNLEEMKMKIWKLCPQGAVREGGVREG
jgi:hypothetical protein